MHFSRFFIILIFTIFISNLSFAANDDPDAFTLDLYEAFYGAIESDNYIEIKQFFNFGIDLNHKYEGGLTPLMLASREGSERTVKTLLDLGADTEYISDDNMTALDYAKIADDQIIISLLKTYSYNNEPLVKEIQFYLQKLNYSPGKIDGILGKKTTSALKKFARDINQPHAAEISYRQVEILKNEYFESN